MFNTGEVVVTASVDLEMTNDAEFSKFVFDSFVRYLSCDWGNICKEDAEQNEYALTNDEQLIGVYNYPEDEELTIWIITEWDRSATTILFPIEY